MPNTQESINEVCTHRCLPEVKKGFRCEVDGKKGRIWGGNHSANFNVKFDDNGQIANCHPYWRMKIFDKTGTVIYEGED